MRVRRWLLLSLLLVAAGLAPVIGADKPPPAVPLTQRRAQKAVEVTGRLYRHTDAVEAAASDALILSQTVPKDRLRYYRYLTVHNLPPQIRIEGLKISNLVLNSISRSPDLVIPAVGGPDNILLRVDLFKLCIDPKVWDKFGEKDPYFHEKIFEQQIITEKTGQKEWVSTDETYKAEDGKYYYKQELREKTVTKVSDKVTKVAAAGYCNPRAMSALIDKLQSTSPILRADWFIVNATIPPDYYDFLGFKTLDDYLDFVGFDPRHAEIKEARASVVLSGDGGLCPRVAQNNRLLERCPSLYGYIWQTFDYKTSIGANNVINNFLNHKRDAGEYIATGPNGLQYYFLVDGKDKRLNEGAIEVVNDSMSIDSRVINGRSCIWCHAKGINEFKSNFQLQVGKRPDQSDLAIYDKEILTNPKKALALQERVERLLGNPQWPTIIAGDQKIYQKSVKVATGGLDSSNMAAAFKHHWDSYFFDRLDSERLCWELGYNNTQIRSILALRPDGVSNGVLVQQLLHPPIAIRRDQFEEVFPVLGRLTNLLPPPTPAQRKMKYP